MSRTVRLELMLIASAVVIAACSVGARAQQAADVNPAELPNPYQLVEG
jgi:hypothetical protein